jgi:transposase-like protein
MKVKRYTTETKIRILREARSNDQTIQDVCRERQISEQSLSPGIDVRHERLAGILGCTVVPTRIGRKKRMPGWQS